jgi:antitoxin PrlF
MTTAIVQHGHVEIPDEILDQAGFREGMRLEVKLGEDGAIHLHPAPLRSVRDLFGMLHRPGAPTVSIEEMDRQVGLALAADDARIRRGE